MLRIRMHHLPSFWSILRRRSMLTSGRGQLKEEAQLQGRSCIQFPRAWLSVAGNLLKTSGLRSDGLRYEV